jgi:hypothetical protein
MNQRGKGEMVMKKWMMIALLVVSLVGVAVCFSAIRAVAAEKDDEIQELKQMLRDLEGEKDGEINNLRRRIEALEKEREIKETPSGEIEELKERVTELKTQVAEQRSLYERLGKFLQDHKFKAGLRMQAWYQFVEDGEKNGQEDLHDFMLRRFYFYLKGEVMPKFGFFAHIAADRIGQDGLDKASLGLGSSIAVRDGWIYYDFHEAFKFQIGRYYIPFTRNYGTTSTFAMLPLDLPFNQGGVRGGIFYASKVGRDDGVVLWGNPLGGTIQYRLNVSEGVEDGDNPDDNLRFTGRVSVSFLEPETSWFNKGTYLGKKRVLSIGGGYDYQKDLTLGGKENQDNVAWTADVFFDHPVGEGAVTVEAAYIDVDNVTQELKYSWLTKGDDAQMFYVQGGYLFPWEVGPGRVQPYFRYEYLDVDDKDDTAFPCAGLNYYLMGHNARITADWTMLVQRENFAPTGSYSGKDQHIFTFQVAAGF